MKYKNDMKTEKSILLLKKMKIPLKKNSTSSSLHHLIGFPI